MMSNIEGTILHGVSAIAKPDWAALFPGEAEGWDYYAACERGARAEMQSGAVAVYDSEGLAAAAPIFLSTYRLDTPLQGRLRLVADKVASLAPNLMSMKLLGVGSAYAEQCHIGLRAGLSRLGTRQVFHVLVQTIEGHGAACGASLIAFKDMTPGRVLQFSHLLRKAGFTPIQSLPIANLDLADLDYGAYFSRLSPSTRRDLRRKLKRNGDVRIEHRTSLEGIADRVAELYESTRRHSQVHYGDFEELPDNYFREVARIGPDSVHFVLYWVGSHLAAFNLLLLQPDRVIDKFLGLSYPLASEKNLYALSWLENVRFAIENGYPNLQSGQTAYGLKVRYGSDLIPSVLYAKHRGPLLNRLVRLSARYIDFNRWDPDLRVLAAKNADKRRI